MTIPHRNHTGLCVALLAAAAAPSALRAQHRELRLERVAVQTLQPGVSAFTFEDLESDGRSEIVLAHDDGTVGILELDATSSLELRAGDPLRLARPAHSVLALVDLTDDGVRELVVLSSQGAAAHGVAEDGQFSSEPITLTTSGRLGFRVGAPMFVGFVQDVNADGLLDLVVPRGREYELWLRVPGDGAPRYDLSQTLPVEFEHSMWSRSDALSEEMRNRIRIPRLDIEDLNGDGRPDLRVSEGSRRLFFLQGEDDRFADEPITLDLSIFRDTTPEASVELGETIVLSDHPQFQSGDLDGDGIPDYVIAHRRKVWSFLASEKGPQFTDATTRMVAEDVSGMLLMHLDDDDREDLVVFKVDVPSAGQLVLGLVSSIDVEVTVLGYSTDPNGDFESRAERRRTLTLRAPSLLSILGQAEDLVGRFTEVLSKYRWSTIGDFDGDGERDLTLIAEDGRSVELWVSPKGGQRPGRATQRWLRELLFEDPNTVFDIDRLLQLAAQAFDTRTSAMTGQRPPDARGTLPARPGRYVVALEAADLDGDGRDEVILVDDDEQSPGQLGIVVLRWSNGS